MPANRERRSGLTDWERAAEDIDHAEWALLEALDAGDAGRVREAEDRLAQKPAPRRPAAARSRGAPAHGMRTKPCRGPPDGVDGRRAPGGA